MKPHSIKTSIALCVTTIALSGYAYGAESVLSVVNGATQIIDKPTNLSALTIAEGATLNAPAGYGLTMTVNGISTGIKPGTYKGKVVLTPTQDVTERFTDMGLNDTYRYRSALFVDNGVRVPEKSVMSAVVGGEVTDSVANNISITSREDNFNGIFITGNSQYTINNAKLDFIGNGGNDFVGYGAAIKTAGNAQVTINNARIKTVGVVRTGVFVGGNSTVTVNNSRIDVRNGATFPAEYKGGPITGMGGVMMEPPWVMGIAGNARATNVVENGTVYYNNSHIKVQGWGALSTDATRNVKLYCNNSTIEVTDSGYGAYADGVSMDTFSGCTFKVPDYGLIMTGGSGIFTDKSVVNSRRIGVMTHSSGSGTLTIDKGSTFTTRDAVIQIKSSFNKVVVDNARLSSKSGVILEAIVNDDPYAGAGMGAGAAGPNGGMGAGGPPAGAPPAAGGGMPGSVTAGPRAINASFSNVTLQGDIIHAMTSLGSMTVAFENATITGGISTSTATPQGKPTAQALQLVGKMNHTFGPVMGNNGLEVTLGRNARWVVSKTSYLTGLTLADDDSVTAPKGRKVTLMVDGKDTPVRAGTFKGAVVLKVDKR